MKKVLPKLSAYQIWWVEFAPEKGIATKKDCNKIDGFNWRENHFDPTTKCFYKHFASKEKAVEFLKNFNKKLSKKYYCRLFSDKQFGMRLEKNGYKVPFTQKQLNEVFIIN